MKIRNILDKKGTHVVTIPVHSLASEAAAMLTGHNIGAAVVVDERSRMVGILSERDLVRCFSERGPAMLSAPVSWMMTPEPQTCDPEDDLQDVLRIMNRGRFRHMPVLEEGRLVGIVSMRDLFAERLVDVEREARELHAYVVGADWPTSTGAHA
ncbi:CBS domain-containing protein [Telmatospirillum sp. J64-1]|uniref:CBS domain-containing protein n=1 Tax=Telmatospirillum sp. J64-1 TaxID=2502183 RepID=UPI00115C6798|nr:CBS domain-containing protein [Telmatospirillum sp. J64-1]